MMERGVRQWSNSGLNGLSGVWEGDSVRMTGATTKWTKCELVFAEDGTIIGKGLSIWEQTTIPFVITGVIDRGLTHVFLHKQHPNDVCTLYDCILDGEKVELCGCYSGGTVRLRRVADLPQVGAPQQRAQELRGPPDVRVGENPRPEFRNPQDARVRELRPENSNKDVLGDFLMKVLGDAKELAKYKDLLLENEVDWAAFRLMDDAHLKELGISMGPRVKLLNALKALPKD